MAHHCSRVQTVEPVFTNRNWINSVMKGTGFRVSWKRMLLHDMSKFSSAELCPYAQHFYGETRGKKEDPQFDAAWVHHCQNNDHHHEHYIDEKTKKAKQMPEDALMELLADWFAAEKAYDGKWPEKGNWKWIDLKFKHVSSTMHPTTVLFLIGLLCIFGFEKNVMKSLGNESAKFDWQDALDKITNEDKALAKRFNVLWNKYKLQNS